MAEIWYSVSPRLKPKRRLPKPMEKTSTRMPQSLATAKWPNSWTRTMMPRTMRSWMTVDMKLGKTSYLMGFWLRSYADGLVGNHFARTLTRGKICFEHFADRRRGLTGY